MRRDRFDTGEVQINFVTGGSGPPVLLLHGYPQCLAMWAQIAPKLTEHYTVVAADLRGYGGSSKPLSKPDRTNYSFRVMARDQIALMRGLGHEQFHIVGHDRGGRTGHRLALDFPRHVLSLAVLDIVPTYAMLMNTNRTVAAAYWHWYFLAQPEPFPEHMIGLDPDFFFETCLTGWGKAKLEEFNSEQLGAYRRAWRDPGMIHGSCSDYRAALAVDVEHDAADLEAKISCPVLAFWGTKGLMHEMFDMEAEWRKRCMNLKATTLPGGHFFPDQFPEETAAQLLAFLNAASRKFRL